MSPQQEIADALRRAVDVFTRRPGMGMHDDAGARAHWRGGTRIVARHASGAEVETDMPGELGGSGDRPSPGWFFRAGIAACAATAVTMVAAEEGIELDYLDVAVDSRSDTRGLLGMRDAAGDAIAAGPAAMQVEVSLGADGVEPDRLRRLVEAALRRSPMQGALLGQPPLTVRVSVGGAQAA